MSAGYAVESSSAPGDPTVGYSTAALEKDARESLLRLARDTDPVTSLREANRSIFLDSKTSMFVTLFYAILDPQKRRLTFVNAGHNPPLLFSSGSPGVSLLNENGIAPGMIDEVDREPVEVTLSPGDVVVLYSNGGCQRTRRGIRHRAALCPRGGIERASGKGDYQRDRAGCQGFHRQKTAVR